MSTNVRFFAGTKEEYLSLPSPRNELGLYFCKDTKELFWADRLLTDGTRIVPTFEDLPSPEIAADGITYFVEETRNGYVLSADRTYWVQVIYAPETESSVKAISFAGIELEEADGVFTIDRACARRAMGLIVPEGMEDEEIVIATEDFVNKAIAEAKLESEDVDLSGYATKEDIADFIKEIPDSYVTEEELAAKGYITNVSDKADLDHNHDDLYEVKGAAEAIKNELLDGAGAAFDTLKELGDLIKTNEDAIEALETIASGKADKEHVHDNYANKEHEHDQYLTAIPEEYITADELAAEGFIKEHQSLVGYATEEFVKEEIGKIELPEIPEVPTKVSELENDAGYLTEHQDLSEYAKKSDIPTDYIKVIPEEYITEAELAEELAKIEHPTVNLDGYATEEYVNEAVGNIEVPDVSNFITMEEVEAKGYITGVPSEYVTEEELSAKGYLTAHQDISHLATKEELPDVSQFIKEIPAEYITESELAAKGYLTEHQSLEEYAKKSELFSGSYNDLDNKPEIPSIAGLASEEYVNNKVASVKVPASTSELTNDSGYITDAELADYVKSSTLESYITEDKLANKDFITSAKLQEELAKIDPTIPSEYITETELEEKGYITATALEGFAKTEDIPDTTGFIKIEDVEAKGYLTAEDITNKADKSDLTDLVTKEELKAVEDKIPALDDYAKKADIPDVSNFATKDQIPSVDGFLTEIPAEYITETELEEKGYLTEHQSLSEYAKLTDIPDVSNLAAKDEVPSIDGLATEDYVDQKVAEIEVPDVRNFVTEETVNTLVATKAEDAPFKTDMFVTSAQGGFVSGDNLNGMAIAAILTKLLGLQSTVTPDEPEVPEEPTTTVDKIIAQEIPMYSITEEGDLAPTAFHLVDGNEAPTESGFYTIKDESGNIIEAGYQDLQVENDSVYYVIALPKEIDYNTMVKVQLFDPDEQIWNDDSALALTSDPDTVSALCGEVGIDITHIDTTKYTVWVQEDICTGSIIRYTIIEEK